MQQSNRFSCWTILLILLAIIPLSFSPPVQKIQLKLNLNEGEVYKQWHLFDQTIQQNLMGEEQVLKQKIGIGYQSEVVSKEESLFELNITYYRIFFEQEGGGQGKLVYDSNDAPEQIPPSILGYATLLNKSFTIKVNPYGKIMEVLGIESMLDEMVQDVVSDQDEELKESIKGNLRAQFGNEAVKQSMERMMAIYPDKPVGPGDSWSKKSEIGLGMPLKLNTSFTIKKIYDDQVGLWVESEVHSVKDEPVSMGGMQLRYDISGTQKGSTILNQHSGWVEGMEILQDISGTVYTDGALSWPISITSVNTAKLEM